MHQYCYDRDLPRGDWKGYVGSYTLCRWTDALEQNLQAVVVGYDEPLDGRPALPAECIFLAPIRQPEFLDGSSGKLSVVECAVPNTTHHVRCSTCHAAHLATHTCILYPAPFPTRAQGAAAMIAHTKLWNISKPQSTSTDTDDANGTNDSQMFTADTGHLSYHRMRPYEDRYASRRKSLGQKMVPFDMIEYPKAGEYVHSQTSKSSRALLPTM